MDLQSLTEADVRELADSTKIFYRGEDYYESGMVSRDRYHRYPALRDEFARLYPYQPTTRWNSA